MNNVLSSLFLKVVFSKGWTVWFPLQLGYTTPRLHIIPAKSLVSLFSSKDTCSHFSAVPVWNIPSLQIKLS